MEPGHPAAHRSVECCMGQLATEVGAAAVGTGAEDAGRPEWLVRCGLLRLLPHGIGL